MSKLFSTREVERILLKADFVFVSQSGSHMKFVKGTCTVIVPADRKEIPRGTLSSIKRQSGIPHIFRK
ncbi:MAG: type II toxin-antitoxin system HicA family toxin [Minisyncoccia bacterium]